MTTVQTIWIVWMTAEVIISIFTHGQIYTRNVFYNVIALVLLNTMLYYGNFWN